jgi:prepilin-type N-terminal cleavage/methylation domain-containing protein
MKKSKGFTLIELMIVVAIIGILSAIAIPKFADLIRKSNEGATKGNLGAIRSAMSIYYGENEGLYPVGAAVNAGLQLTMDTGKYIKSIPNSYEPPYHAATNAFIVSATTGTEASPDQGKWAYQSAKTPVNPGDQPWGNVWVNCTHTDSKAFQWSNY